MHTFSQQNFPLLKRLKTLLVSNNLIFRIGEDLKDSLPNLHTIMLANNSLLNIRDLKPFASLPSLRRLCLIDNNVTKQVLSLHLFAEFVRACTQTNTHLHTCIDAHKGDFAADGVGANAKIASDNLN